jgi:hypothetical protein
MGSLVRVGRSRSGCRELCIDAGRDTDRPSYAELEALVVAQAARIAQFEARVGEQDRLIAELRQRLDANSPPSAA